MPRRHKDPDAIFYESEVQREIRIDVNERTNPLSMYVYKKIFVYVCTHTEVDR